MTFKEEIEKKHGWDENGGVYQCSDGTHNSWWVSISKTPQWQEWYEHALKNMLYDVDECLECGWMSEEHAKDFMKYVVSRTIQLCKEAVPDEELRSPEVSGHLFNEEDGGCLACWETYGIEKGFNRARETTLKNLSALEKEV